MVVVDAEVTAVVMVDAEVMTLAVVDAEVTAVAVVVAAVVVVDAEVMTVAVVDAEVTATTKKSLTSNDNISTVIKNPLARGYIPTGNKIPLKCMRESKYFFVIPKKSTSQRVVTRWDGYKIFIKAPQWSI